jgi:hypothetical protein
VKERRSEGEEVRESERKERRSESQRGRRKEEGGRSADRMTA